MARRRKVVLAGSPSGWDDKHPRGPRGPRSTALPLGSSTAIRPPDTICLHLIKNHSNTNQQQRAAKMNLKKNLFHSTTFTAFRLPFHVLDKVPLNPSRFSKCNRIYISQKKPSFSLERKSCYCNSKLEACRLVLTS